MWWHIERRLDIIERMLGVILTAQKLEFKMELKTMLKIDDMLAEVERQTTVVDSIAVMVNALQDEVTAANGDKAKIQAAFDKIKANTDKLSEAALENTPEGGGSTGGVGGGSTGGVGGGSTGGV